LNGVFLFGQERGAPGISKASEAPGAESGKSVEADWQAGKRNGYDFVVIFEVDLFAAFEAN
jgi:hypothetical protein